MDRWELDKPHDMPERNDEFYYMVKKLYSFVLRLDKVIFDTTFYFGAKFTFDETEEILKKLTESDEFKKIFEKQHIILRKKDMVLDGVKLEGKVQGYSFNGDIIMIGNEKKNLVEKLQMSFTANSVLRGDLQDVLDSFWSVIRGSERDLFTLLSERDLPINPPRGERVIITAKREPSIFILYSALNNISNSKIKTKIEVPSRITFEKSNYIITILYDDEKNMEELHIEGPWGNIGNLAVVLLPYL